jgi:hypothetical protein
MKNRKREIRTSGSVRDEGGQHPHLLGRRQFLHLAAGAAALPAASRIARAQTYPSRPITIIAPAPAGGGTDTIARIIAEPMRVPLGRPIIIENVSGANGSIGVGRVARAAPTVTRYAWVSGAPTGRSRRRRRRRGICPPHTIDYTSIFDLTTIQPTALPTPLCSWLVPIRPRFKSAVDCTGRPQRKSRS